MRQKYKEDFLVLNDLFIRTCRVVEHIPLLAERMREVGATTDMDALAFQYDLGDNQFASSPTYKLHTKNFSHFVVELEGFAKKTKQLNADIETSLKDHGASHEVRFKRELRMQARHDNEWASLKGRYAAAFHVLVKVDPLSLNGPRPSPYVNMLLCPREGTQLALFNKFIQAYLEIEGFEVKGVPGVKPGTRLDTWQIQKAYKWLLPIAEKIVRDFKNQRDRSRDLTAAVKVIKKRNTGAPRGSWKAIEPYLKGNRCHSSKKLTLKILSYYLGISSRSMEKYVYMKR